MMPSCKFTPQAQRIYWIAEISLRQETATEATA
jgi:hypothetical protein